MIFLFCGKSPKVVFFQKAFLNRSLCEELQDKWKLLLIQLISTKIQLNVNLHFWLGRTFIWPLFQKLFSYFLFS